MMRALSAVVMIVATVALAACGGGSDAALPDLSPAAEQGRTIALDSGCVACHGDRGQGGVGPGWQGLAGTEVELEDGTTVVADAAYLRRSIADPGEDVVAGTTVNMPTNQLTDDEIDLVVAYIQELR